MNRLLAATAALTLLGCQDPASGFPDESDPTPEPGENTLPFRVQDRRLAVYDPDFEHSSLKGATANGPTHQR